MRILLLPSAYYPHKGGVEEVTRHLAASYSRMGHAVLVVAPLWPHSLPVSESVAGQRVVRLAMPLPARHWRSLASFLLRVIPSVGRLLSIGRGWRPDVVHVQCVGPNGLYALVLASLLRLPLIVTSQGEQTMDAGRLYERSAVQRWVLRCLLRRANQITACSADALRNLAPYGTVTSTAAVVPNGVDLAELQQGSRTPPHAQPYIFAIGRHVWNKGFDVLLRAYARVAREYGDVDLILAGDGPEHANLTALAINRAFVATYFRHCCFFVLPSLREPFGIVILEAMAAGKAVIVTRAGGVPEIIRHDHTGLLIPAGDDVALVTALEQLLRDPARATELGRAGAQIVSHRYAWDKVAASYLTLYNHIRSQLGAPDTKSPSRRGKTASASPDRAGAPHVSTRASRADLVCIGQEDWDEIWRRNQFLVAGLARVGATHRTLFVEQPCDVTYALRTGALFAAGSAQRRKLALALKGPRACADAPGLWLLTPVKLLPNSMPLPRDANQRLERLQVRRAMGMLRMRRPLFWTQNPEAAHWVARLDAALTIYDATDDWSLLDGPRGWLEVVRGGQEQLARGTDVVLACSAALCAKWRVLNANTHLIPNGVDGARFGHVGHLSLPPEVARLSRPVLGYTGTLHDERVDVDLICRVAAARPDWQLVFIGPDMLTPASRARLGSCPNIRLLGPRPYHALPAYMSAFCVCLLPHRVTPFTESLNPIKIYEYLATGLPTVSTPVATARDFGDVIYLADTPEAFIAQVECALAEADGLLRQRRRARARASSREERVAALCQILRLGPQAPASRAGPAGPANQAVYQRAPGGGFST
ncbi:MAG: hypothetical protein NVSMB65_02460 [Chloroflexota bacterium]